MSSQPDEAAARAGVSPAAAGPTEPAFAAPAAGRARPGGFGAAAVATSAKLPWKTTADGTTVFRRPAPLILFWLWIAFALFNLFDVALKDHDYFSLELTAGLLAVTAVMYACALRPRVTADADAICVYNPYRDHVAPWGAVSGVYLGDSVELSCVRPSPKSALTIYCWALYSGRRSRLRSQRRSDRHQTRVSGRTPAEIGELRLPDAAHLMAAELGRRSAAAQQRGVPEAVIASRWAWLQVAYLLVPAAALLALILAR
jgi:Bacterial PH domain